MGWNCNQVHRPELKHLSACKMHAPAILQQQDYAVHTNRFQRFSTATLRIPLELENATVDGRSLDTDDQPATKNKKQPKNCNR